MWRWMKINETTATETASTCLACSGCSINVDFGSAGSRGRAGMKHAEFQGPSAVSKNTGAPPQHLPLITVRFVIWLQPVLERCFHVSPMGKHARFVSRKYGGTEAMSGRGQRASPPGTSCSFKLPPGKTPRQGLELRSQVGTPSSILSTAWGTAGVGGSQSWLFL